MKGDFTRLSFNADKQYRAVMMQQGRALLDSDWNEQVEIAEHRYTTLFGDFVGPSGAPAQGGIAVVPIGASNQAMALYFDGATTSVQVPIIALSPMIDLWFLKADLADACLLSWPQIVDIGIVGGRLAVRPAGTDEWMLPERLESIITLDMWHHLTIIRTAALQRKITLKFSVDGSDAGSFTFARGEYQGNPGPFALGASIATEGLRDFWKGAVSEVRFRESPGEIHLIGDLLHHFPFDEPQEAPYAVDAVTQEQAAITGKVLRLRAGPPRGGTSGALATTLTRGHYYVDGLLVEHAEDQPLAKLAGLPTDPGTYILYLDVWPRLITALEEPSLREPALGGPDTTARIKTEWQLRCLDLKGVRLEDVGLNAYKADWRPDPASAPGEMSVQLSGAAADRDSRLYRVEIHQIDAQGKLWFKWSRDNGSLAARVITPAEPWRPGAALTLDETATRVAAMFPRGSWIELSDERHALDCKPGLIASVSDIDANTLTVTWDASASPAERDLVAPVIVRRWEAKPAPASGSDPTPLEQSGVQVSFTGAPGQYRAGDYWLIPLRAGVAQGWVSGVSQQTAGPRHRYAALAAIAVEGGRIVGAKDLRIIFEPLTSELKSVAGDLCVRGVLGVGFQDTTLRRAPLSVSALPGGALLSLADGAGAEMWRVAHSSTGTPTLSITDTEGKGLTIQQGGNIYWGSGSVLQGNQGGSIELVGDPKQDNGGKGRPYIDFRYGSSPHGLEDYNARIINDADGQLSLFTPTLYVDGKVGIGTTEPKAKLAIDPQGFGGLLIGSGLRGDTSLSLTISEKSGGHATIEAVKNEGTAWGNLALNPSGGNVGIGTTEPSEKLVIESDSGKVDASILFRAADRPNGQYFDAIRLHAGWLDEGKHSWGDQRLSIQGKTSATDWREILSCTANGTIDVGDATHRAKLNITGDLFVDGGINFQLSRGPFQYKVYILGVENCASGLSDHIYLNTGVSSAEYIALICGYEIYPIFSPELASGNQVWKVKVGLPLAPVTGTVRILFIPKTWIGGQVVSWW